MRGGLSGKVRIGKVVLRGFRTSSLIGVFAERRIDGVKGTR
jgi:hypothetical protein